MKTVKRGNGLTTTNAYTAQRDAGQPDHRRRRRQPGRGQSYAYDNHKNLTRKTSTTAKPSRCRDLYAGPDHVRHLHHHLPLRLLRPAVASAVYAGATPAGTPVTKLAYALDAAGNVESTSRTTTTTSSAAEPTVGQDGHDQHPRRRRSAHSPAGRLGQHRPDLDADGRVLKSLSGTTTSYRPDGLPATVTKGGATTSFSYWADGTRRRASTTDPVNGNRCVGFYYGAEGRWSTTPRPPRAGRRRRDQRVVPLTAGRRPAPCSR